MSLRYIDHKLCFDNINLKTLAEEYKTPLFVYSYDTIKRNYNECESSLKDLKHIIFYALKANSNLNIINCIKDLGSGFDTVSGGEIFRALKIKADPKKIVYSGVGKTIEDIDYALNSNILLFNVESVSELNTINNRAIALNKKADISIRVNPDVDPQTHPYICTGLEKNKFGIDIKQAFDVYKYAVELNGIIPKGIHMHIGSQLLDVMPFKDAFVKVFDLYKGLKENGLKLDYINIGGGMGICYNKKTQTAPAYSDLIKGTIHDGIKNNDLTLLLEPGRSIIGNAGILITKVLYKKSNKQKNFVIVDAGMNDAPRPSLYSAYHEITPVLESKKHEKEIVDVVGPICESTDFLAKDREIEKVGEGDYLAVESSGAYCSSMSSNYNSRLKPAEVMIKNGKTIVIRKKDSFDDLIEMK